MLSAQEITHISIIERKLYRRLLLCAYLKVDKRTSVHIDVKMNWPNTNNFFSQINSVHLHKCRYVYIFTIGNRSSIIVNIVTNLSFSQICSCSMSHYEKKKGQKEQVRSGVNLCVKWKAIWLIDIKKLKKNDKSY